MTIGIVSTYEWLKKWDNYGSLLQNYALQTFLQRRGHTTFLIRTLDRHHPPRRIWMRRMRGKLSRGFRNFFRIFVMPSYGKSGKKWRSRTAAEINSQRLTQFNGAHPRRFSEFIARHVPTTAKEFTILELAQEPPAVDALIVGSDQMWGRVSKIRFLDFGSPALRRVAYAVSAPWPALDADWVHRAAQYMSKFNAVSVREAEGLPVCAKLGRHDAVHVLDPVLLLDADDYLKIVQQDIGARQRLSRFVLGYFVNVSNDGQIPWKVTDGLAKSLRANLRIVPLQGAELVIPDEYVFTPTPSAWLNAFHEADCVVTNSYHGTLFAIIMRKPFLVFLQGGATTQENCRFGSVLDLLDLQDRMLPPEKWSCATVETIADLMAKSIAWDHVAEKLYKLRELSEQFLDEALCGPLATSSGPHLERPEIHNRPDMGPNYTHALNLEK